VDTTTEGVKASVVIIDKLLKREVFQATVKLNVVTLKEILEGANTYSSDSP
jgi:hypothetical protein